MARLVSTYLAPDRHHRVLDVGSRTSGTQTVTHRELFAGRRCSFIGTDVRPGPNVDVVMKQPYRLPLRSSSVDVVVSGQVFEHIPFFWVTALEIRRVLRPGGWFFMTAPSRGHVHTDVDCWRYYPDGLRAMAAFAQLDLLEAHTDLPPLQGKRRHDYAAIDTTDRYWVDTVGVFQ